MPAQQTAIRRLRLNEWTEQVTRWIDTAVWDGAQPFDEEVQKAPSARAFRSCSNSAITSRAWS